MEGENTTLRIDEWVVFRSDAELAHLALQLRQKWSSLFLRRLHSPGKPMSQVDNSVVETLVNILSAEEQNLGLMQPAGIGQRPKQLGATENTMCSSPGPHMESSSRPPPSGPPPPPGAYGNMSGGGGSGRRGPQGGNGMRPAGSGQQGGRGAQQFFPRAPYR